jgi:hypothetical protein
MSAPYRHPCAGCWHSRGRDRPYREYPPEWVLRNLEQAAYVVKDVQRIPIRCCERFINSQLDLRSRILDMLQDRCLALACRTAQPGPVTLAASTGGLWRDYIVVAEPR